MRVGSHKSVNAFLAIGNPKAWENNHWYILNKICNKTRPRSSQSGVVNVSIVKLTRILLPAQISRTMDIVRDNGGR